MTLNPFLVKADTVNDGHFIGVFSDENIVSQKDDVGLHYVYITDILDDGTIFVSSCGRKYIFDPTNALEISKVLVKINS